MLTKKKDRKSVCKPGLSVCLICLSDIKIRLSQSWLLIYSVHPANLEAVLLRSVTTMGWCEESVRARESAEKKLLFTLSLKSWGNKQNETWGVCSCASRSRVRPSWRAAQRVLDRCWESKITNEPTGNRRKIKQQTTANKEQDIKEGCMESERGNEQYGSRMKVAKQGEHEGRNKYQSRYGKKKEPGKGRRGKVEEG